MFRTIQIASCVSVQGEFVAVLADGKVLIRDGAKTYRGHPVEREGHVLSLPVNVLHALKRQTLTPPGAI